MKSGWILACVLFLCAQNPCAAHPISLSYLTLDVQEDKAIAEIEILAEDLVLYQQVPLTDGEVYAADLMKTAASKHCKFLESYFIVRDANGRSIKGVLKNIDMQSLDSGVAQADLKKKQVLYRYEFAIPKQSPFVTVMQFFGGKKAILPSLMDCTILQNGVLLEFSRQLLANKPHSIRLDWENPPKRAPKSLKEIRQRKQAERERRLGITSYSGLYSFVYITPTHVRHEILVPLLTLEDWLPIKRKNPEFLEVNEQIAAADSIERLFASKCVVKANGKTLDTKLSRLNFFGLDINDFALNAKPRKVSVYQARLGIILSYPTASRPTDVSVNWHLLNEQTTFLKSTVYVGDSAPKEFRFTRDNAEFLWKGTLDAPGLAKSGFVRDGLTTGTIKPGSEKAVLLGLLKHAYAAFELRNDSQRYDRLAQIATGELLRRLFLQFKQSLMMSEQGGAIARVRKVNVISTNVKERENGRFKCEVRWRAAGSVEHWGHIHTRDNEYSANFVIVAKSDGWRIADYRFLSQRRIRFQTTLRGFEDVSGADKRSK